MQTRASVELLRRSQQRSFPYSTMVDGERFVVFKNVFSPAYFESTTPFSNWLSSQKLGRLLELGCGIGATGILAVRRRAAERAVLLDINPSAIRNARRNADLHGVSTRVRCFRSDVFSALHSRARFDSIYWNTPFLWRHAGYECRSELEHALFDPGYKIMERFLSGARHFLHPKGRLFIGFGDFGAPVRLERLLDRYGWSSKCVARWDRREGYPVQFQIHEARHVDT